jgi:hypothetical protein
MSDYIEIAFYLIGILLCIPWAMFLFSYNKELSKRRDWLTEIANIKDPNGIVTGKQKHRPRNT